MEIFFSAVIVRISDFLVMEDGGFRKEADVAVCPPDIATGGAGGIASRWQVPITGGKNGGKRRAEILCH